MSPRIRLLVILAFVVILVGVGLALILPTLNNDDGGTDTGDSTDAGGTGVVVPPEDEVSSDPPTPTPEPVELVQIVVAIQNIARGAVIPPNAIDLRLWPIDAVPATALIGPESIEVVVGKRARVDIFQEQPILQTIIVDDLSQIASVGSDLSASLPLNTRAVAVPIDRLTSVAYGLQPGDSVDIIISLLFVEIDEEFQTILPNELNLYTINEDGSITILSGIEGRFETVAGPQGAIPVVFGPREEPRPRLSTQLTIQDALVMGIGDFPPDGILFRAPTPTPAVVEDQTETRGLANAPAADVPTAAPIDRPDIVTLAVSPQEAVVLTYYVESRIPITFALRAANDTSQIPTDPVTLDYIMQTYNIRLPAALPYGIQPAIRSIRQLVGGEVITLANQSQQEAQ